MTFIHCSTALCVAIIFFHCCPISFHYCKAKRIQSWIRLFYCIIYVWSTWYLSHTMLSLSSALGIIFKSVKGIAEYKWSFQSELSPFFLWEMVYGIFWSLLWTSTNVYFLSLGFSLLHMVPIRCRSRFVSRSLQISILTFTKQGHSILSSWSFINSAMLIPL